MRTIFVFATALAVCASAAATVRHDESVNGDLSTNNLTPTPITMGIGSNIVIGRVTAAGDTRDYFTFAIAPGWSLTGIFLLEYTNVATGGAGNTGFMHIDDGTTSVIPSGTTMTEFLGGTHLDRSIAPDAFTNLLTILAGAPAGGTGFTAPLGPGDYTINVQQTSALLTQYSLEFVIIPAPATAALFGLAPLALRRRR